MSSSGSAGSFSSSSSTSCNFAACFYCKNTCFTDQLRNGWRLRNGQFAQLCQPCGSVYEEGRFCETFHSDKDGWADCKSCGKLVHCGCIVSFNAYLLLDSGGVSCMECSKIDFLLARSQGLSRETQTGTQDASADVANVEPQKSRSVVTLFEKLLSASDADPKLGRIVIPKKYAETFFPEISEPQGFPIKILDTEGKEWEFSYRFWLNSCSKMYVLEGLKDFMISKKWQAGDVVTFYWMEPQRKMIVGLKQRCEDVPQFSG